MSSVFDLVDDQGEVSEDVQITSNLDGKKIPWWKSIPSDLIKGLVEGVSRAGRIMGPLQVDQSEEEIQQGLTQQLETLLPSDSTLIGNTLRKGGQILPQVAIFPGVTGAVPRSAAAGSLSVGAKALGAPEWVQTASEILPFLSPSFSKNINPKSKQKEAVEFLRSQGVKEKEIAPLLQEGRQKIGSLELPTKSETLSKVAEKGQRTKTALRESKQALGRIYESLKTSPEAEVILSSSASNKFTSDFNKKFFDLPSKIQDTIKQDVNQFFNSTRSGEDLIKLYQKINYNYGPKTKQLQTLHKPIIEAMYKISPKLGKDFQLTNDLMTKWFSISNKLSPKNFELINQLINLSEYGRVLGGVLYGQYPLLLETLGEKSARVLSREMLINPRLQNLTKQMITSLNSNKFGVANQLMSKYIKEVSKESPEAAEQLSQIDFLELFSD